MQVRVRRSGFGDGYGERFLMVEGDGDGVGLAVVPVGLGDGEVEHHHAFGVVAGRDGGLAGQRGAGEWLERGEGDVHAVEVVLSDSAGGGGLDGVVGRGEGPGDVVDGERDLEAIVDVDGGEDVEVVLGLVFVADDPGEGLEDSVLGQDGGVGDGDVGDAVRPEIDVREDATDDDKGNEQGDQEAAAFRLREGEFRQGSQG